MWTVQKLLSFKTQLLTLQIAVPYGVTELNMEAVSLVTIKDFWTHNDQSIIRNRILNESKVLWQQNCLCSSPLILNTHEQAASWMLCYVMSMNVFQTTSDQVKTTLCYELRSFSMYISFFFFYTHHGFIKKNKLFSSPWSFLRP